MSNNRQAELEMMPRWVTVGLFAGLVATALWTTARPAMAQPGVQGPRLYVFDCGTLINLRPETYNLTREEVPDPTMSVSCYLVVHPKGTLLYDTGLSDKLVGRPLYETKRGQTSQLVLKTLRGQLADIGYTPDKINYLVISHMHFDHVSNANDYARATWLVQKVEREAMFGDNLQAQVMNPDYAALKTAKTQLLEGDYDVFADGAVVIKSTPGHTIGHQSLFVKLARTGGVVLSGDLYHYPAERTLKRMPDREKTTQTPASRAALEVFLKNTGAQLWIGHDILAFAKQRKSPEYYD